MSLYLETYTSTYVCTYMSIHTHTWMFMKFMETFRFCFYPTYQAFWVPCVCILVVPQPLCWVKALLTLIVLSAHEQRKPQHAHDNYCTQECVSWQPGSFCSLIIMHIFPEDFPVPGSCLSGQPFCCRGIPRGAPFCHIISISASWHCENVPSILPPCFRDSRVDVLPWPSLDPRAVPRGRVMMTINLALVHWHCFRLLLFAI